MSKIILSSSILSADFSKLEEQISDAEKSGVDWIHIDVMDGHFVPNITMGPFIVEHCRKITNLPIDVHLMIEKPEKHINSFVTAGATKLSVHIENNPNIYRTLQEIRSLGASPAIVLNPGTPACAIQSVLELIDMVLIMTVNPGFSGQKFIPGMLPKISEVRDMIAAIQSDAIIQVDGGITASTLPDSFKAGARVFVAATAIFGHPNGISCGIEELRKSVH